MTPTRLLEAIELAYATVMRMLLKSGTETLAAPERLERSESGSRTRFHMPAIKTPGVFIIEKNAFPNSVVEVATAVPAFVGYTEKAEDRGKPLEGKPWRISSMACCLWLSRISSFLILTDAMSSTWKDSASCISAVCLG